jgi:hypothetical protein
MTSPQEQMLLNAYQNSTFAGGGPRVLMEAPTGERVLMSEQAAADVDEMMLQQQMPSAPPEEPGLLEQAADVTGAPIDFAADAVGGALVGLARGLGNMQAIVPIPTMTTDDGTQITNLQEVGQYISGLLERTTGVTAVVEEPEGIVPALASGVGQMLPGVIPAVKAMKAAGMGPLLADTLGGLVGDFLTSSKTEAEGLSDLIAMIPSEYATGVSAAIDDFIADPEAMGDEDLRGRLVASVPGLVLTPAIGGVIKLVAAAKNSGVAADVWQGMRKRWDEGKSPIPLGMSIEDVGEGGHPGQISTRLPTAVKATEDPVTSQLSIGYPEIQANEKVFKHNVGLLRGYPNVAAKISKNSEKAGEEFIEQAKGNLLWLYNKVPEETRQRSKLWYDGGNAVVNRWAEKYGVPDTSIAGVLAATSPQTDWFVNVTKAERILDIVTTKQDHVFDDAMVATAGRILADKKYNKLRKAALGKRLSDLDGPAEKAFWLRIYDEAHNSRGYRMLSPEGDFGDMVLTADGSEAKAAWGSLIEIEKSIAAIEAAGDKSLITPLMGTKHKVRSFYNNLLDPNSPAGDVTIDTHAVAAALLRPVSGSSAEVHHNFGSTPMKVKQPKNWRGAKNSAVDGVQGTYGIYAEAYRRAASELGILPRELQSITWEAVRGLFPDGFKNAKNMADIDALWRQYRRGSVGIEEVRNAVEQRAGGFTAPVWEGRVSPDDGEVRNSSYAGELPRSSLPRKRAGRAVGRGRGGAAGDVPSKVKRPRRAKGAGDGG